MSLILDALKRAERERPARGIDLAPDSGTLARTRAPRHWLPVAVVIVGLVIGAVVWRFLVRDRAQPEPVAAKAPAALQPSSSAPPTPPAGMQAPLPASPPIQASPPGPGPAPSPQKPAPAPWTAPQPTIIPGTEAVASLDDLTTESMEPDPAPTFDLAPPEPAAALPPAEQVATESEVPVDDASAAREPERMTGRGQPAPERQREIPPALTQPAPLRKFREMPAEYRADFPALSVEVHVYERAPQQRFVIVNGRRYRERETLAEGPVLVEIARDGLVLEYRGQRLLYPMTR